MKKKGMFLWVGMISIINTVLAVGNGTITWISTAPLTDKVACLQPKTAVKFQGLPTKMMVDSFSVDLDPKNVRFYKTPNGFYVSYLEGELTAVVNNKIEKSPVSAFGISNHLNGSYYYAYRTPVCTGYIKVDLQGYQDKDFFSMAAAALAPSASEVPKTTAVAQKQADLNKK